MVDTLSMEVLDAVQTAAESSLPYPARKNGVKAMKKVVPGWKETVKPYRDNAFFWHQVWISCERPMNTEVHNIMKRTRNLYHYQYKKCKKVEEQTRKK